MSNFGFLHLRVVNPYEVAFREARSAVGASALLASAEEFHSVSDAVADCTLVVGTTAVRHRELQQPLRHLADGAPVIRKQLKSSRVALVFGSEKVGLSNRDLSHCDWVMNIPTRAEHASMNLGQAVAVCLYELAPSRTEHRQSELVDSRATAGTLDRITCTLLDALCASGYVHSGTEASTEDKVRRLLRRLNLNSRDAEIWLGMLKQILWKLRQQ